MRRDDALKILTAHSDELRRLRVCSLALFGSVARDEAGAGSDVDLLVELERPAGLFALARLQRYLEQILGSQVDLVARTSLRPELREAVLREAIDVA